MNRFTVASALDALHKNVNLLRSLTRRDLESRYRGTALGFLWVVVYPLTLLAVYTFVFGTIFNARWGMKGHVGDFVMMLYCGLIVYGLFADTLTRSPAAVLANPGYVKKVVFPLELLPVVHLFSALFNALIGLGLLTLYILFKTHALPWTTLLLPLVLLPLALLTAGFAWFLAAIGVFFRDVGQIINVLMSLMMFLSPVFYPMSSVPPIVQSLMYLNPLTYPIETLRQVIVGGVAPVWAHWFLYTLASVLMAVAGLWVFQRSRPAFADVV